MESLPRRPWYLLVAIAIAWLFGIGGCTEGTQIIGSYWSAAPDPSEIAADAPDDESRATIRDAAERCLAASDRGERRQFPLGVGTLLLGAATVVFAARAMAGRKSARSLLVQLVVVQALFVGSGEILLRDVKRDCADLRLAQLRASLEPAQRARVPTTLPPDVLSLGMILGVSLRGAVAALVVLSLTRPRSRAWFDAIDRRRAEGP